MKARGGDRSPGATIDPRTPIRLLPPPWLIGCWVLTALAGVGLAVFKQLDATDVARSALMYLTLPVSWWAVSGGAPLRPAIAPMAFAWLWYCLAPAVIGWTSALSDDQPGALSVAQDASDVAPLVAGGSCALSIGMESTRRMLGQAASPIAKLLSPTNGRFDDRQYLCWVTGLSIWWIASPAVAYFAPSAIESTDAMGGTRTNTWWIGLIASVSATESMLTSALVVQATQGTRSMSRVARCLLLITIVRAGWFAVSGGWKSPLIVLAAFAGIAVTLQRGRPPWLLAGVSAACFVLVIAPFVTSARDALKLRAEDSQAARVETFLETLRAPSSWAPRSFGELQRYLRQPFRDILPVDAEIVRRSDWFSGEWKGATIEWAFEVVTPRALLPSKRDTTIGNEVAQQFGVDAGVVHSEDRTTSIAIFVPFEFVGNYGLLAGLLAFFGIGAVWTVWCWVILGSSWKCSPLVPYLFVQAMSMEAPLGNWLVSMRQATIGILWLTAFLAVGKLIRRRGTCGDSIGGVPE